MPARRLAAVPYTSPRWRTRYPALAGYRLATCAAPTGNRIAGNVAVDWFCAAMKGFGIYAVPPEMAADNPAFEHERGPQRDIASRK